MSSNYEDEDGNVSDFCTEVAEEARGDSGGEEESPCDAPAGPALTDLWSVTEDSDASGVSPELARDAADLVRWGDTRAARLQGLLVLGKLAACARGRQARASEARRVLSFCGIAPFLLHLVQPPDTAGGAVGEGGEVRAAAVRVLLAFLDAVTETRPRRPEHHHRRRPLPYPTPLTEPQAAVVGAAELAAVPALLRSREAGCRCVGAHLVGKLAAARADRRDAMAALGVLPALEECVSAADSGEELLLLLVPAVAAFLTLPPPPSDTARAATRLLLLLCDAEGRRGARVQAAALEAVADVLVGPTRSTAGDDGGRAALRRLLEEEGAARVALSLAQDALAEHAQVLPAATSVVARLARGAGPARLSAIVEAGGVGTLCGALGLPPESEEAHTIRDNVSEVLHTIAGASADGAHADLGAEGVLRRLVTLLSSPAGTAAAEGEEEMSRRRRVGAAAALSELTSRQEGSRLSAVLGGAEGLLLPLLGAALESAVMSAERLFNELSQSAARACASSDALPPQARRAALRLLSRPLRQPDGGLRNNMVEKLCSACLGSLLRCAGGDCDAVQAALDEGVVAVMASALRGQTRDARHPLPDEFAGLARAAMPTQLRLLYSEDTVAALAAAAGGEAEVLRAVALGALDVFTSAGTRAPRTSAAEREAAFEACVAPALGACLRGSDEAARAGAAALVRSLAPNALPGVFVALLSGTERGGRCGVVEGSVLHALLLSATDGAHRLNRSTAARKAAAYAVADLVRAAEVSSSRCCVALPVATRARALLLAARTEAEADGALQMAAAAVCGGGGGGGGSEAAARALASDGGVRGLFSAAALAPFHAPLVCRIVAALCDGGEDAALTPAALAREVGLARSVGAAEGVRQGAALLVARLPLASPSIWSALEAAGAPHPL